MTDEPLAVQALGGRSIPDLLEQLRQGSFPASPSEAIDVTELLLGLARHKPQGLNGEQLRAHLQPILCKDSARERQEAFIRIYNRWWQQGVTGSIPTNSAPETPALTVAPSPVQAAWKKRLFVVLFLGALLAVGAGLWIRLHPPAPLPAVVPPTVTGVQIPAPTAQTEKSAPPAIAASTTTERIYGYWPAYHYFQVLRPELAWAATTLPIGVLALLLLLAMPRMALGRQRGSSSGLALDGWPRDKLAKDLVQPLPDETVSRLDRHVRGPIKDWRQLSRRPPIDLRRTVEATLRTLGIPQLRYRHAQLRPSYLVLVEADHDESLVVLWAERLRNEGVEIDLRRVEVKADGNVPDCIEVKRDAPRSIPFDRLPAPAVGQRLMLVSDGRFLVDSQGEWHAWARGAGLERWPERVAFSPREPRDFFTGPLANLDAGMRAGDPGFLVLPQEETALAAWSNWLVTGHLSTISLEDTRNYPRLLLEGGEARYLRDYSGDSKDRPDNAEIGRLVSEISLYLGENGFYWLCCCAVPPIIDPQLTLQLGEEYLQGAGARKEQLRQHLASNYRLLVRLPWIRHNSMPDWLRLALLARLPEHIQDEVRAVVNRRLDPLRPSLHGDLPLDIEPPAGNSTPTMAGTGPAVAKRDALYLGFMSGINAAELSLRLPGRWTGWLGHIDRFRSPWQRLRERLRAALARLFFRDGLRQQGLARGTLVLGGGLLAVVIGILAAIATLPSDRWPAPLQRALFADHSERLTLQHKGVVLWAVFSPDGRRVVTASYDNTARLWDAESGQALGPPLRHENVVNHAAFSPDGRRVVTASYDKTARLWDAESGQALGPPLHHENIVWHAAFSPDGRRVVTASGDKTARLWDAESGQAIGPPLRHEGLVTHAAFSPDGRRVVTASVDYTARLWDAESGQALGPPLRHENVVNHAAFSPDGRRVVTASGDKTARLWDAKSGQAIGPPLRHEGWVNHAAFSPDGRRVVTASVDETARLWDAESGQALGPPLRHENVVNHAAFSPDGRRVVTASEDNTARLWDAESGQALGPPLRHEGWLSHAAFSPDSRRVVTASYDKTARLWDAESGQALGPPLRHEGRVNHAAFSPDGRRVVTASYDKTARLWDAESGQARGQPLRHEDRVIHAAFSPDGRRVVTASWDNTARLWDAETGQALGPLLSHEGVVNLAAFSPDGRRVVTASGDKTARLWDAETGQAIGPPLRHEGGVNHAAFSPDGRRVVTASWDNTARLWDAESGQAIGPPLRHENWVNHAAFSPDGRRVVTASGDNTARLWDAESGQAIGPPLRHEDRVWLSVFSPDGRQVLTASADETARLWDGKTGQALGQPLRHEASVNHATFSPDSRRVVTTSADHTARLWDAESGSPLGLVKASGSVFIAQFHPTKDRLLVAGLAPRQDATAPGATMPTPAEPALPTAKGAGFPDNLNLISQAHAEVPVNSSPRSFRQSPLPEATRSPPAAESVKAGNQTALGAATPSGLSRPDGMATTSPPASEDSKGMDLAGQGAAKAAGAGTLRAKSHKKAAVRDPSPQAMAPSTANARSTMQRPPNDPTATVDDSAGEARIWRIPPHPDDRSSRPALGIAPATVGEALGVAIPLVTILALALGLSGLGRLRTRLRQFETAGVR